MNKLEKLLKQRQELIDQAQALIDAAQEDGDRELNDEEFSAYEGIDKKIKAIDRDIKIEKTAIENRRVQDELGKYMSQSSGRPHFGDPNLTPGEAKDVESFSYIKMVRETVDGNLTGVELEMAQEAKAQAQASGVDLKGIGIPQMVLSRAGRPMNELSVTQDLGHYGGKLVPTELRSLIDILRSSLVTRELGAQLIGGLVGNVDLPRANDTASPTHKSETGASDKVSPQFDSVSLRPKRLPVHGVVTRQLLLQSSIEVEAWFRSFLAYKISTAMDVGAIAGSGTGDSPTGLFNTANVPIVSIGADGGAVTRSHVVKLEGIIDASNANFGNIGYLTTPQVRTALKDTKLDAGSGRFVWEEREELNGYTAKVSTHVPSNLTKGTSAGVCHGMAFGNWAGMIIGQWGGLDLLVNPYSLDTEGKIRLNLWTFYDVAIERPEMFGLIKDITVS